MPLKLIVKTLDEVDEKYRDLYSQQEDGSFRLNVQGAVPRETLDEFRTNNINLKNELDAANTKLDALKDIDVEKFNEYKKIAESKGNSDDIERQINDRIAPITAAHEKAVKELQDKLNYSEQSLKSQKIMTEIRQAASEFGVRPSALMDVEGRANGNFDIVNGKIVNIVDGKIQYGQDGVTPRGTKEWISDLQKNASHLFAENRGGGAGNPGMPGAKDPSKMTPMEKLQAGFDEA